MAAAIPTVVQASATQRHRAAASGGEGSDKDSRQLAWQREMERAQLSGWFRAAPPSADPSIQPQAPRFRAAAGVVDQLPKALPAPSIAWLSAEAPNRSSAMAEGGGGGVSTMAMAMALQGSSPSRDALLHGAVDFLEPSTTLARQASPLSGPRETEAIDRVTALASSTNPAPETSPISVHTESAAAGVSVWLGMREATPGLIDMLPTLVADLRRGLEERGQRLHQVVCNGRLVWREGRPVREFESFYSKEP
ncbi:hypothetical protein [Variovorax arabinosiphilus]|uniref:hypothetical protein n=1 Tax=Variovorax arabinosiphilus TaxID=3053498 RepID=UPI0025772476|nr:MULTISPECIES: hypothetical protein [unclassified Variovorax]MDM0122195.1 hypothetical protein [Variovorax sp. J2L1-78]MDM0131276.1 hypothetical protein [Variovorax sp. J2L1-63]MDM0234958.1 hypothetical protein [Variovorax sp. J2R1-6]